MAKKETTVFLGTGRRKSSIAGVRIMPGKGNLIVNGKALDEYFGVETLNILEGIKTLPKSWSIEASLIVFSLIDDFNCSDKTE